MKNETKITMFKTSTILGCSFFVVLPICVALSFSSQFDIGLIKKILFGSLFLTCACGMVIILLILFGKMEMPKTKLIKAQFEKGVYESFSSELAEKLLREAFERHELAPKITDLQMTVFTLKSYMHCDVVVAVKVSEMDAEKRDEIENTFTSFLDSFYEGRTIRDTFEWIGFICVDRVTPLFKTVIIDSTTQDLKRSNIGVGISFGSNAYYMADVHDGFGILRHKKLKKKTKRLIESIFAELA